MLFRSTGRQYRLCTGCGPEHTPEGPLATDRPSNLSQAPKDKRHNIWGVGAASCVTLPVTNQCDSHPILRKIEDLADSPLVPALLEKIHTESDPALLKASIRQHSPTVRELTDEEARQYKSTHKYETLLLPYLRELTRRQLECDLIAYVTSVNALCPFSYPLPNC